MKTSAVCRQLYSAVLVGIACLIFFLPIAIADPATIDLSESNLHCTLQLRSNAVVCDDIVNQKTQFNWAASQSNIGACLKQGSLAVAGFSAASGLKLIDHRVDPREGCQELVTNWSGPQGLNVQWTARNLPQRSVLEFDTQLENAGKEPIHEFTGLGALAIGLKDDDGPLRLHWLSRKTYRMQHADLGDTFVLDGGQWNSPEAVGWLAIENPKAKEILFVGVQWESYWKIKLVKQNGQRLLTCSLDLAKVDLKPGEKLLGPRVFLGVASGDLDDSLRELHDYLRQRVFPPSPGDFPWVAYDIWATDPRGVEQAITDEIPIAKDLGVELFYLDASWYAGSAKNGSGDWFTGVGNWEKEDAEKFPNGLANLSKKVHQAGMKFGLWFGPQVVDRHLIGSTIPHSWVATHDGADIGLNIGNGWAPITQICLGDPDVAEHLKTSMANDVEKYQLDWLKWDNSGAPGPVCNCADHGHQAQDGALAAIRGEYDVYDYLHKRFPDLVLENCGYGSRLDYGLARYARANWLSDDTGNALNCRQSQIQGSYAFPAVHNAAWVVKSDEIAKETDATILDTIVRSRMIGIFGMGTLTGMLKERISLYPPEVRQALKRNIAGYKTFRHLLNEDVYHLLPPSTTADQWDAIEFCKRDGSEAVLMVFRSDSSSDSQNLKLRGLAGNRSFIQTSLNTGSSQKVAGSSLSSEGVSVALAKAKASEIILFKAE